MNEKQKKINEKILNEVYTIKNELDSWKDKKPNGKANDKFYKYMNEKYGFSKRKIYDKLKLLNMPHDVFEEFENGNITAYSYIDTPNKVIKKIRDSKYNSIRNILSDLLDITKKMNKINKTEYENLDKDKLRSLYLCIQYIRDFLFTVENDILEYDIFDNNK